jgi:hypothetical protein
MKTVLLPIQYFEKHHKITMVFNNRIAVSGMTYLGRLFPKKMHTPPGRDMK